MGDPKTKEIRNKFHKKEPCFQCGSKMFWNDQFYLLNRIERLEQVVNEAKDLVDSRMDNLPGLEDALDALKKSEYEFERVI